MFSFWEWPPVNWSSTLRKRDLSSALHLCSGQACRRTHHDNISLNLLTLAECIGFSCFAARIGSPIFHDNDMITRTLLLLVLTVTFLCSGCTASISGDCPVDKQTSAKTIYLVNHGWHVGIVIKRDDLPDNIWPDHKNFADTEYLEIGWGDKDFYQTPNPHFGIALKAVLLPTPSVLHIAAFNNSVTSYFPHSKIIMIQISKAGFQNLIGYIATSFYRDSTGNTVHLGVGLYGVSQFYQSRDTYHLFRTCNIWTARALHAAGCPVRPFLAITANNLMVQAQSIGRILQDSPSNE